MKFYRTSPEVFNQVRSGLDVLWGHPKTAVHEETNTEVVTISCLPEEGKMLHDDQGKVLVAISDEMSEWPEIAAQLVQLIDSQMVEVITKEVYQSFVPVSIPQ